MLTQPAASWAADLVKEAQEGPIPTPLDNPVLQTTIGKTPQQGSYIGWLLLFSPLIIYGIFTVYRTQINPQAKLSNFALIVTGLGILANIFSIVVFKVRWF